MLRLAICLVLAAFTGAVLACKMPAPPQPVLATTQADMVVTGTVVEIADMPTMAKSHPDAKDETAYSVAIVRINRALHGAKNLTHVRVAVPFGTLDRTGAPFHKEGQYLFILQQHSATNVMLLSRTQAPVNLNMPGAADVLHRVTVATNAIHDPVKALTLSSKQDRTLAAIALVQSYRRIPAAPRGYVSADRPAEESRLLFSVLAEADWTSNGTPENGNIYALMHSIGLEEQGFSVSGQNGADPVKLLKDRFMKWFAAEGKTARMKHFVAKQ